MSYNAICYITQSFQKPIKLDTGHYGIPLKNTLYKLSHFTTLATAKSSIVVIAFSFRTDAILTDKDAYIFTNKNTSRGVTISLNAVNILGAEQDWSCTMIMMTGIL